MDFFIPKAESPEEAEELWLANRDHLRANGYGVTDRRIYEIRYRHNSESLIATVGRPEPLTKGLILMIFEASPFLICTPDRGFVTNSEVPIYAGTPDRIVDFNVG